MWQIGKSEELYVIRKVNFGAYLGETPDAPIPEQVLLPAKEIPEGTGVGDRLLVFLYKDSEDRPIATMRKPQLELGQIGRLRCAALSSFGAFLHWGLEKDLFLPYREQTAPVEKGGEYLVALYLDRSGRLCATMKLYDRLEQKSPYAAGDQVNGTIYDRSDKFGVFVAVDDRYSARIPDREDYGNLKVGQQISARVTRVLEDGRLDLSVQEKSYLQMDADAGKLMDELEKRGGELPFGDKSDPELIRREIHMSKAAFKRAAGRLMKQKKILIEDERIRIV